MNNCSSCGAMKLVYASVNQVLSIAQGQDPGPMMEVYSPDMSVQQLDDWDDLIAPHVILLIEGKASAIFDTTDENEN